MSNNEKPAIWAFNKAGDPKARRLIYQSVRDGKSRFGWSREDINDLSDKNNYWEKENGRQRRLLEVKPGDWIVHRNTPEWGQFVAARVTSGYQFDEGLQCSWGPDFRHCFEVDKDIIVKFDRLNPNVLPTVRLNQRQRLERIYEVADFLASIDNLKKGGTVELDEGESKEGHHLRAKTDKELLSVTKLIHETHKGKKLEGFLAQVLRKTPGVKEVEEHGKKGGADHGADLIVRMRDPLLDIVRTIIVQVKSYEGEHRDLGAVEQVKTGIEEFGGDAGMIITTAEGTKKLYDEIEKVSEEINRPITLLAGPEVSRFVIKHAPELLFNL